MQVIYKLLESFLYICLKSKYMQHVREVIRRERRAQDLTQSDLAEKIGKSRGYISGIETGHIHMSLATANRILHHLGLFA